MGSWTRWFSGSHHGKSRTTSSSGGGSKSEHFVGRKGGGFTSHVSVQTKSNGRRSAHAGQHRDKK